MVARRRPARGKDRYTEARTAIAAMCRSAREFPAVRREQRSALTSQACTGMIICGNGERRCRPIQPYGDPPGSGNIILDTNLHTPYSTNDDPAAFTSRNARLRKPPTIVVRQRLFSEQFQSDLGHPAVWTRTSAFSRAESAIISRLAIRERATTSTAGTRERSAAKTLDLRHAAVAIGQLHRDGSRLRGELQIRRRFMRDRAGVAHIAGRHL